MLSMWKDGACEGKLSGGETSRKNDLDSNSKNVSLILGEGDLL